MSQLGPFQSLWDAWDEAGEAIRAKPLEHFESAIGAQFTEMREHLDEGRHRNAANEAVDIISIALNLLRRLGYQPHEIATLAEDRAEHRMRGKTADILDKYRRLFGI